MGIEDGTRTVAFATVGCKLNQYETEGMAELFERAGYVVVPFEDGADVCVVNTCTVTMRSDYRSRQMLRRAGRGNPDSLVVATGCYAERDSQALALLSDIDLVVGNGVKAKLVEIVEEHRHGRTGPEKTKIIRTPLGADSFRSLDIGEFRDHTRAFIKIQDGCDRRCAYCAVPDARGPARSRPFDEVLAQAERLARNGYREIVLTGVHIGGYGTDLDGRRLSDLLTALVGVDGLERVRLGSIEPSELTLDLADAVCAHDGVCNHLHVPMESGSNKILRQMRRDYTREQYAEAVRRVTDRDALCGLGADVMVGFPGETDEDFADTVELIERLPFTYLHVFAYSPRSNTPAASMDEQVPSAEKGERSRFLRDLGRRESLAFRSGLIGQSVEVLVEQRSRGRSDYLSGLSPNYIRVEFEGDASLKNRFVELTLVGADDTSTMGELIAGTER